MAFLGTIKLGDNLTFYANTHTPSTGAAVDADAVPGYRVYEDETATPLLTGSMALLDDANTTGFYSEQIAVTTGNGFEAGKSYCVRITGVVASVTGVEVHTFSIDTKRIGDLQDIAAGAAMTLATGAITAAVIATDAIDADAVAADVGTELGTAVWVSTTRTLTTSAAAGSSAISGSLLTIQRGDYVTASITGLGNISTRTKLYFTLKYNVDDLDEAAIVQIEETAGLGTFNGTGLFTAPVAADASITVTNATTGAVTIVFKSALTRNLPHRRALVYDMQMITASGATTLTNALCNVTGDVTRLIT